MHRQTSSSVPWRRRASTAVAVGAALALLAGCAGSDDAGAGDTAEETTRLSVALGWISNVEYGGFWLADSNGYYAERGLEIDWIPGGPEAPTVEATLAAGTADIGVSASMRSVVEAMADNDFTLIGSVFQENPGCILWLADDPIENADDLSGRRILAQDESTVTALFEVNGLEHDYEFIPTSFDPGPLVAGDGDAYTAYYVNQPVTMQTAYGLTEGEDFGCTLYSELGLPLYASSIFAPVAAIEADPGVYTAFLEATRLGWEDFLADPDAAAALAVEEYGADLGLDIEQQSIQAQRQVDLIQNALTDEHGLLYMDLALIGGAMTEALESSGTSFVPPAEEMVDLSLLDEINGR